MSRFTKTFLAGVILALGASPALAQESQQQSPQAVAAPAGNADRGAGFYKTYGCYQCHGYAAHGGGGPKLGPDPMPWQAFSRYVRRPTGSMPPYTSKVLKESELADIYAHLQRVPRSPDVKDIPLLNE